MQELVLRLVLLDGRDGNLFVNLKKVEGAEILLHLRPHNFPLGKVPFD